MEAFGGIPVLSSILLLTAAVIVLSTTIWTVVVAFRFRAVWGVALVVSLGLGLATNAMSLDARLHYSLLLMALGLAQLALYVTFLVVAWEEAKHPFFWLLSSIPLYLMGFFVWFSSVPGSAERFAEELRKRGLNVQIHFDPSDSAPRKPGSPGSRPGGLFSRSEPSGNSNTPSDPTLPPPIKPGEVFHSKLPPPHLPPGQPDMAPPGTFYLVQRVTAQNASGFRAANVGEKVTLLGRLPGKKLKVTVGNADFVVHESQLTDDLDVARQAEKEDFVLRGGKL